MAIDKGSLDYRIRVSDSFSRPIAKFRSDLLKARNTAKFVKEELRDVNKEIGRLGTTTSKAGASTRKLTDQEKAHWKAVREGARSAAAAESLRARALKTQKGEQARQNKAAAAAARRAAVAAEKAARARKAAAKAAAAASARALRNQKRLNRELARTQGRGNRLILTFKRLAGVFVGFQAIRFGAEALRESITAGIRFNAVMEDARIGIAGMVATIAEVRNEEGKLVEGADKFAAALGIADDQLEQIRRRSLATVATFPQLIEAFQAGVAPGLEAGLSLDEIVTVTERVSQAAAGLRIQQNQLNEEIRSLLRGTAQARTSLVATILFGGAENANKRIKEAREVGNVFEVINERLKILGIAANETQRTFTGTLARLKGVLQFTAGRGSILFFNELKEIMNQVSDIFVKTTRTAEGFIEDVTPRESTVIILGQAFQTLRNIVLLVREFLAGLKGNEIANFIVIIGAAVELMAALILGALDGAIRGIALLGSLFNALGFALGSLDLEQVVELASIIATIAVLAVTAKVAIVGWSLVLGFAAKAAGIVRIALFGIATVAQVILQGIGKIPGAVFRAAGVVALLGLAFLKVTQAVAGIDLALADLPEVIGLVIEQIASKAIGLAKIVATSIKSAIQVAIAEVSNFIADLLEDANEQLSIFRGDVGAQELVQANELKKVERLAAITNIRLQAELQLKEIKAEAAQIDSDADSRAGARLAALEEEIEKRTRAAAEAERLAAATDEANTNAKGLLETLTAPITNLITGLIGEDIIDTEAIAKAIADAIEKGKSGATATPVDGDKQIASFAQSVEKAFASMANSYQNTLSIMKSLTSQFASFVSAEIVIALDPNSEAEGESAQERFKRFLGQIGRLIIQKLVELAIAKTILAVAGASEGGQVGAARGGQIGFDDGGTVPGGKHEARKFRPAAVALSDTVPAWLTPGEFVEPVKAVLKYGADLFEGLRTGAIDPVALREAAGLTNRRKSVRKVRARGYVEGGPVGLEAARGAAKIQQQENSLTRDEGGQISPALMVSDDQLMERLMAGGQRAWRNWAENEKEFFRGIVRE